MIALARFIVFLVAAALYPVRFAAYCLHVFVVFLTKPGARFILPAIVIFGAWASYETGGTVESLVEPAAQFVREVLGTEWGELAYRYRGILASVAGFFVIGWLVDIIAGLLRPIVHSLPAPRRPLWPLLPLRVPGHTIATVPATVAVTSPGKGRYRGDLAEIVTRLQPDIRTLLEARPRPEPVGPAAVKPPAPQEPPEPSPVMPEHAPAQEDTPVRPRPVQTEARVPGRRQVSSRQEPHREES